MGFFTDRTAIVTGAGSGIGRALALALAGAGCRVVITDIVQERIDSVLAELRGKGAEAGGYRVDHSRLAEVEAFADAFFRQWGRVDILCSNAGVGHGGWYEEMSLEDWEWVMGVNLWGTVYTMHAFVPKMIARRQGSILLTASDAGLVAMPGMTAYTAGKYAVVGMGETMRIELSRHNLKVSLLCPGDIATGIIRDGRVYLRDGSGRSNKSEVEEYYRTRGVSPDVVAGAALRGLERDRAIIVVPWIHHGPLILLRRLSPQLYHAVLRFALKKGIVHKMLGLRR